MPNQIVEGDFYTHQSGDTAQVHSVRVVSEQGRCFLQVSMLTPDGTRTLRTTHEEFTKEWQKIHGENHY
jgi:hypothetical protein